MYYCIINVLLPVRISRVLALSKGSSFYSAL